MTYDAVARHAGFCDRRQLYHLGDDPLEQRNLVEARPDMYDVLLPLILRHVRRCLTLTLTPTPTLTLTLALALTLTLIGEACRGRQPGAAYEDQGRHTRQHVRPRRRRQRQRQR